METEYLQTTVDKFVFKVKKDCWYSESGIWVQVTGDLARAGVSDYIQQSSGDVAFAEIEPVDTQLVQGDYLGQIETIKVAIDLFSAVSGTIQEVNGELDARPELINQDPYGQGWLALIALSNWETDRSVLLSAEAYLEVMHGQAEEAAKKL